MDDLNQNPKLGSADRPNSYIGRSVPRERAKKLLEGKGKYVDDILLPRMVHLSYVRSPFAHAKIKSINTENAKKIPGVLNVFTIDDIEKIKHIPCSIIQGRYDIVCPAASAWEVHKRWPISELLIADISGHSAFEKQISSLLIQSTNKYIT